MVTFIQGLDPILQALLGSSFGWLMTALGAVPVFFARHFNRRVLDSMLGMAAGVMVAASFWSLLAPAIELSDGSWVPAVVGFIAGGAALRGIDRILPHLHPAMRGGE
ncbi:MAG TPA: ZIP family metal transporter, partial [Chloroflexi bacterium]|nr:ZIP family metal transporter [Chloroflexota bacterium]